MQLSNGFEDRGPRVRDRHQCPLKFDRQRTHSVIVRHRA